MVQRRATLADAVAAKSIILDNVKGLLMRPFFIENFLALLLNDLSFPRGGITRFVGRLNQPKEVVDLQQP